MKKLFLLCALWVVPQVTWAHCDHMNLAALKIHVREHIQEFQLLLAQPEPAQIAAECQELIHHAKHYLHLARELKQSSQYRALAKDLEKISYQLIEAGHQLDLHQSLHLLQQCNLIFEKIQN